MEEVQVDSAGRNRDGTCRRDFHVGGGMRTRGNRTRSKRKRV